jgi:hypothetical protein
VQRLQRLTLKVKLWAAFGFLILATVSIGELGLRGMAHRQEELQQLIDRQWARTRESQQVIAMVNENLRSRLETFLAADTASIRRMFAEQGDQSARISTHYDHLRLEIRRTGAPRHDCRQATGVPRIVRTGEGDAPPRAARAGGHGDDVERSPAPQ